MTTKEIVINVYIASIGKISTVSYYLLHDVRILNDVSSTVTMDFQAQQIWSLCREKTSEYRMTIRRKHFYTPQDFWVKSLRLADTCTKLEEALERSEEINISWQTGWGWEGRGGMGKRFPLCLLIFDLVELPSDFKGEGA